MWKEQLPRHFTHTFLVTEPSFTQASQSWQGSRGQSLPHLHRFVRVASCTKRELAINVAARGAFLHVQSLRSESSKDQTDESPTTWVGEERSSPSCNKRERHDHHPASLCCSGTKTDVICTVDSFYASRPYHYSVCTHCFHAPATFCCGVTCERRSRRRFAT